MRAFREFALPHLTTRREKSEPWEARDHVLKETRAEATGPAETNH
jgi:hypothetical protein